MIIDLNTPPVGNYFEATNDPSIWQCKQTGFLLGYGILSFYRKFGGSGLCGLSWLGLPQSNEQPVPGYPGITEQEFERATVRYDSNHQLDAPPGAGSVYLIHIEQDPRFIQLQTQIAQLQQSALAQELQQEQNKLAQIAKIASS